MRKLMIALVTAALLTAGAAGSALAHGPDIKACNPNALGALQAAFGDTTPCESHP